MYVHYCSDVLYVDCIWNVMPHAQKPDFVFPRNGRVHLNGQGRQFSRLLAAEVCASAVVMLDTPCSEVVWRVLFTHSIRQFPLHFPSRASPCAITFQLKSTCNKVKNFTLSGWGPALLNWAADATYIGYWWCDLLNDSEFGSLACGIAEKVRVRPKHVAGAWLHIWCALVAVIHGQNYTSSQLHAYSQSLQQFTKCPVTTALSLSLSSS